jgi:hypothetical protein
MSVTERSNFIKNNIKFMKKNIDYIEYTRDEII